MKARWPMPAGLHSASVWLPDEGELPSLSGATGWLNSPPLTAAGLAGRWSWSNFWTYSCINWLRQLPYVRAWGDTYSSHRLAMIGVHTPEFAFEHDTRNVRRAVQDMRVGYPVAIDSGHAVWRGFSNHYWPALSLRRCAGAPPPSSCGRRRVPAVGDRHPATAGRGRNPGPGRGRAPTPAPKPASLNQDDWALAGDWTAEDQATTLNQAGGQIACRFHARDLHLVIGSAPGTAVRFRARLDGQPPGHDQGADMDGQGHSAVTEPRLYQLMRQHRPVAERTFEITFLDPGVQAYAFTYG